MRYLDRYLDGQHVQVWTELVGIGPSIRDDEQTWADAEAVALETMTRVKRKRAAPRRRAAGPRLPIRLS